MRFWRSRAGIYAQVDLRRNFTIDDAGKRTRFQCAAFHLTRDGAKPQDGYLCVTSWNNKFVKLRLTTLARQQHRGARAQVRHRLDPVLWARRRFACRAGRARAAAVDAEPRPRRAAQAAAPPAMRRAPACPQGYICEYR